MSLRPFQYYGSTHPGFRSLDIAKLRSDFDLSKRMVRQAFDNVSVQISAELKEDTLQLWRSKYPEILTQKLGLEVGKSVLRLVTELPVEDVVEDQPAVAKKQIAFDRLKVVEFHDLYGSDHDLVFYGRPVEALAANQDQYRPVGFSLSLLRAATVIEINKN